MEYSHHSTSMPIACTCTNSVTHYVRLRMYIHM